MLQPCCNRAGQCWGKVPWRFHEGSERLCSKLPWDVAKVDRLCHECRRMSKDVDGPMAPRDVLPLQSLNVSDARRFAWSGRVKWQPKLMVRTCDSDPIWPFSHSKLFEAVLFWQEVIPEQAWPCRGSDFTLWVYEAMDKNMQGLVIWNIQFFTILFMNMQAIWSYTHFFWQLMVLDAFGCCWCLRLLKAGFHEPAEFTACSLGPVSLSHN